VTHRLQGGIGDWIDSWSGRGLTDGCFIANAGWPRHYRTHDGGFARQLAFHVDLAFQLKGPINAGPKSLLGAEATVTINRQDFGVSWSKSLDKGQLVVSNDVKIDINVEAGTKLIAEKGLSETAHFVKGDAFDRDSLASVEPKPTLGVVSGLYELFSDNTIVRRSLACLAAASAIAMVAPAWSIRVGLVCLAALDIVLVWATPSVRQASNTLEHLQSPVAAGMSLPSLQQPAFGHAFMGWLDLLAPALLGVVVAGRTKLCRRRHGHRRRHGRSRSHDLHGCRQVNTPATPAFPTSLSVRNGGRAGPTNAPCNAERDIEAVRSLRD